MVIFSGKNLKTKVNQIGYIDSKLVEGGQGQAASAVGESEAVVRAATRYFDLP